MTTTEVRGCCPHDCPDTCSWTATVEDGVVTGVRGNRDHPFTAGHLCIKVNHYEERVYHPDRILTPRLRTGPKGTHSFREATWDEALTVVRDGLTRVLERAGPSAILPCSYMGTQGVLQSESMDRRFFNRVGAAELDRNICFAPGAWAWAFTYPGFAGTDPETIGEADVTIAWGTNPFSTHLHFWPFFQAVRKRGGTLVTVDPFRSKTAAASDFHIQLRPGSDGALALGLLHVLFAEGLEDRDYLEAHTVGADDLRARAAQWPVARAALATGLDPAVISDLARLWGRARPGFIKLGPGANRHAHSGQAFRAVLALPAVTGAWQYPGGGAHVHTASAFPDRGEAMTRPDLRATPPERAVPMTELGAALQRDIGALVVYNCNPAVVCPDTTAVTRGLAREDLFTVALELMPTDTVAYADVVLPATTQLEHVDVLWSWGHYYLSLNRPAIAPRGQARPNTEIFRMLATTMGFDEPALLEDDETLLATYLEGCTAEQRTALEARGFVKLPVRHAPDAKAMLRADSLAELAGVDAVPDAPDAAALDGDGLVLITPKAHHFLNSQLVNHERLRKAAGRPVALLAASDAAAAGVADGAAVRLGNEHGSLTLDATVSDLVLAGTVVVVDNWWHEDFPSGRGVNVLTGQSRTDLGAAPIFTARVTVSPAP